MSMTGRKSNGDIATRTSKPKHAIKRKQDAKTLKVDNKVSTELKKTEKRDFKFKEPQVEKNQPQNESEEVYATHHHCTQTTAVFENHLKQALKCYSFDKNGLITTTAAVTSLLTAKQTRERQLIKLTEELTRLSQQQHTHFCSSLESIEEVVSPWPQIPMCCKK